MANTSIGITGSTSIEQALRASEARYRSLAEATTSTLWSTDPEGLVVVEMPSWAAYTGQTWDDYKGNGWANAIHPEDLPEVSRRWQQALATGEVYECPGRVWHAASGEYHHCEMRGVPVRDAEGQIREWIGTTNDVHDEYLALELLQQQEERFHALAGVLPALVVTTTPEGEIEDINDRYAAYTGLTLEQAKDWANHQVIHPDDLDQSMAIWGEHLRTGEPMQNQMRLRRHDGVYRWYIVQAMPVRDAQGRIVRWVTVNIDIEDRRRHEDHRQLMAETAARLLSSLDAGEILRELANLSVPALADICAIGLFDDTPRTYRVETSGLLPDERPLVDRIHLRSWQISPDDPRRIGDVIAAGEVVHIPDFSPEWIATCAADQDQADAAIALGGTSIVCAPLVVRSRPIGMATFALSRSRRRYDDADLVLIKELMARASIAVDNARLVSDLKETAEHLRRANEAKDEFLGLVSHELKTPITMILGNAEVLSRRFDELDREARLSALGDIQFEADRLHRIIDNLLVLARLDQGQALDGEPLLVRRIVEQVAATHRRQFPARVVEMHVSEELTPVAASAEYLELVIRNLLSNAEKYSPKGEPIEVVIERRGDEAQVRVLDRGAGVSEDDLEQIFAPFYRSASTREMAPGIGIGLTVCQRLIEAQGGRMWVHRRPDGGSEFGFALPATPGALPD